MKSVSKTVCGWVAAMLLLACNTHALTYTVGGLVYDTDGNGHRLNVAPGVTLGTNGNDLNVAGDLNTGTGSTNDSSLTLYDSSGIPSSIQATNGGLSINALRLSFPNAGVFYAGAVAGSPDSGVAINAAITAAQNAGGGIVIIPYGTFNITNGISITNSDVTLLGAGSHGDIWKNGTPTNGTILKWTGLAGGTIISVTTGPGIASARKGIRIRGLTLEGNNSAATGLYISSVNSSYFQDIYIRDCTTVALDCTTTPGLLDGVSDVQRCGFEDVVIQQSFNSTNGIGFRMDSNAGGGAYTNGNFSFNTIRNLTVRHSNGAGIQLGDTDSNTFIDVHAIRSSGTGIGVELKGSSVANKGHARANSFYGFSCGTGGLTSRATALTQAAVNNAIYFYNQENGEPEPTIESGSIVTIQKMRGDQIFSDVTLLREAANALSQRNGTSAQSHYLYNTYTDASNYERAALTWAGNIIFFQAQNAGTGSLRSMAFNAVQHFFQVSGTTKWNMTSSGHWVPTTDNNVDIGSSSLQVRQLYAVTERVGLIATPAVAGTIASAATIAPTSRITFLSGTTGVDTITAPSPISSTGGEMIFIPKDGAVIVSTSGNVLIGVTMAQNKACRLAYDAGTAKWYIPN